MFSRVWSVAVLLLTLCGAGQAVAHQRSESHSVWEINGENVDLVMTIPSIEAARLSTDTNAPSDETLIKYLTPLVYPVADSKPCALVPPVDTLSATPGYRKYDFTYRCPTARQLDIHSAAFFDLVPSHTNFAQIQNAVTGEFTEQLITNERQTVTIIGGAENRLQSASFFDYIGLGIMHIFTGVDHQSFLLGLVLISRRLRDLIFVVTGFTIGHSLTLALAVTGVLRPHAEFIDALVALTILLIGAENIAVSTRRPATVAMVLVSGIGLMAIGEYFGYGDLPVLLLLGAGLFVSSYLIFSSHLQDAARLRLLITLVFGLIHGFGFAANLLEMQLPKVRLAELLVGFNLGVEIGQLTIVAGITLLVLALTRLKLALPRPIVVDVVAAGLVGIGVFWFVGRSYS